MPDAKSTYDALTAICGDLQNKPIDAALDTARARLPDIDPANQGAYAHVNNLLIMTRSTLSAITAARSAAYAAANPAPPLPADAS